MVVVEVLSGDDNCGGIVVVINGVRWQWQKLGNDNNKGCYAVVAMVDGIKRWRLCQRMPNNHGSDKRCQ